MTYNKINKGLCIQHQQRISELLNSGTEERVFVSRPLSAKVTYIEKVLWETWAGLINKFHWIKSYLTHSH